jgi:hypothetical protein
VKIKDERFMTKKGDLILVKRKKEKEDAGRSNESQNRSNRSKK